MSDNKKFRLIIAGVVMLLLGLSAVLKNLPKDSSKPVDNSVASAEAATEQTTEAPTEETIATTESATPETAAETSEAATEEADPDATESSDDANTATEETKDSAAETLTEAPAEAAAEVATEVPTEAPAEVPTEAPAPVVAAYTFRNQKLLDQHYEKHGIDMGFSSAADYEAAASAVITNPAALSKQEKDDGDYVYYVEATNEFVVLSKDGYIRTYFLPDRGKAYYDKQ